MDPRIAYVLQTFRALYDVPDEIQILYGDLPSAANKLVRVKSHAGTFFDQEHDLNPEQLVFRQWYDRQIPFLFEDSDQNAIIEQSGDEVIVNYDIIAAAFYFLSGWQEFVTPSQDYADGRFPYRQSLQYRLDQPAVPWVNYYFDILKRAVELAFEIELYARRGETDFHLAVTHDIDTLFSGWYQECYHAIRHGNILQPFRILAERSGGPQGDPWYNLTWLYSLVRDMKANATFYFLAETTSVDGNKQADYRLDDPLLRDLVHNLQQRGAEIAIHGSIGSHLDSSRLKSEMQQLDAAVTGGRFHYLYYDIRNTPTVLRESGLQHDSTLGFAEQAGFRNAYAHPFYLYDLQHNERTDILEIPLVIMDATLHHRQYMNLDPEEGLVRSLEIMEELRKFHGAAAILWHNSYFSDFKYRGWGEVFIELLHYCRDQGGAAVSASELVPHYSI
ncbi:MAG: polysaccharide deacetylase family protein [Balneolaceae bacterium]|nr:polysaccharide deacetylase family protein [Balneolaceae bacterium]